MEKSKIELAKAIADAEGISVVEAHRLIVEANTPHRSYRRKINPVKLAAARKLLRENREK